MNIIQVALGLLGLPNAGLSKAEQAELNELKLILEEEYDIVPAVASVYELSAFPLPVIKPFVVRNEKKRHVVPKVIGREQKRVLGKRRR